MEWGVLFFTLLGLLLGGIVLQATFAARHWRRVIEAGDVDALREAVDGAFESWQRQKSYMEPRLNWAAASPCSPVPTYASLAASGGRWASRSTSRVASPC